MHHRPHRLRPDAIPLRRRTISWPCGRGWLDFPGVGTTVSPGVPRYGHGGCLGPSRTQRRTRRRPPRWARSRIRLSATTTTGAEIPAGVAWKPVVGLVHFGASAAGGEWLNGALKDSLGSLAPAHRCSALMPVLRGGHRPVEFVATSGTFSRPLVRHGPRSSRAVIASTSTSAHGSPSSKIQGGASLWRVCGRRTAGPHGRVEAGGALAPTAQPHLARRGCAYTTRACGKRRSFRRCRVLVLMMEDGSRYCWCLPCQPRRPAMASRSEWMLFTGGVGPSAGASRRRRWTCPRFPRAGIVPRTDVLDRRAAVSCTWHRGPAWPSICCYEPQARMDYGNQWSFVPHVFLFSWRTTVDFLRYEKTYHMLLPVEAKLFT